MGECFPLAFQSNLPESTITPPSEDFRQRFQEYQRKYTLNGYFAQKRQDK